MNDLSLLEEEEEEEEEEEDDDDNDGLPICRTTVMPFVSARFLWLDVFARADEEKGVALVG
jgi:hypothetical protein